MKRVLVAGLLALTAAACDRKPTEPTPPAPRDYRVGEVYQFNVQSREGRDPCEDADYRDGRVISISQRAIVVADVDNPSGEGTFTSSEYRQFGERFDDLVWPVLVENFGEPADVDGNGRVIIFFTRAVNEMTPAGQSWYVGGFFHPRDLFPQSETRRFQACPGSNHGEMFYMLVPDPEGEVNGNKRTKDRELAGTLTVIGHEFQHLINASRRLHVQELGGSSWSEEIWLNEGLSHIAEELLGYAHSPLAPRTNIDAHRLNVQGGERSAFGEYQFSNFTRLETYLSNPAATSVIGPDSLSTRGAAWQFLRYAADRRSGSEAGFWRQLVDSPSRGLTNLGEALGTDPMEWINDWSVAVHADDLVAGIDARYDQPSWNFRSVFRDLRSNGQPVWGEYPLEVQALTHGNPTQLVVPGGGAVYLRFIVPPGVQSRIRLDGASGACRAVELSVGEVLRIPENDAGHLCVEGGAAGGEYAYIPFLASTLASERRSLEVMATGVVTPTSSRAAVAQRAHGVTLGTAAAVHASDRAHEWELNFRRRAVEQLSHRVASGSAARTYTGPAPTQQGPGVEAGLSISLVRVR